MALKRKGEDPKTKVKVTSVKEDVTPNAENKRKMDEYNAASAAYKSAESKYKSDVEAYNKQIKAYSEQPKGRRDMTTFFQGGGRYLNPQELEAFNKENEDVSRRGGLKASKVYVSKDYGKEGVAMGYSGYKGAYHEWLDKPTAPKKQTLAEPKAPNLSLERMPMLKVKKIESTSSKKLATPTEKETPEWEAPSRKYMKTKSGKKIAYNVSAGEFIGGEINRGKQKDGSVRLGSYLAPKSKSKIKESGFQYNREGKEAKAYYGGFEGQTKSDINERRGAIKAEKRELRQGIKDVRRGVTPASESLSKSERIQGYRKEIKNLRAENKQAKQAGKYFDKNLEARSFYDDGREVVRAQAKEKPGAKFFTPEAMKGYRESMNNPANRNTISAKIKNQKK